MNELKEFECQLEERYRMLAEVESKLENAKSDFKLQEELWEERADIYHDIGVYTVSIKKHKEKNPPYKNKIKFDPNW